MIPPFVLFHLRLLYRRAFFCLTSSAIGAYLHLIWSIGRLLTTLGFIGSIVWIFVIPPTWKEDKWVSLFMVAEFFTGASIGPLAELVLAVDQGFIVHALVRTAIVFGCFYIVAMLTKHRVHIYVGGSLSCLSIAILLNISSTIFGGYSSTWKWSLFYLLVLCVGYIMWYSQLIIEQSRHSNLYPMIHGLAYITVLPVGLIVLVTCLLKISSK